MYRKINKIAKTYFYFNNSERKSIIILFVLIAITLAIPQLYFKIFPVSSFQISITELQQKNTSFFATKPYEKRYTGTQNLALKNITIFNPNTASDMDLSALGFSSSNIKTIRNYMAKGGSFKKPDDIKKLYGLDKKLLEKILPLVQIENSNKTLPSKISYADSLYKYKAKKTNEALEINSTDSASLVKLYRIGPKLASKIITQRNKLGGFLSLSQLTEIWGFDEDILYDLQDKIKIDVSKVKRINLNEVDLETLKQHPYYKFKLSQAIVNYRMQHGKFKTLLELKNIRLVNDSIYKLITNYGYVN